jgi:hypothetical protein
MKTPKSKLLALLVLFIFVACAGTKKVTTDKVSTEVKKETQLEKKTETKESGSVSDKSTSKIDSTAIKSLEQIEKLTSLFESRLKTYDTSKPVDPKTGTPPLVSELIISNNTTKDIKQTDNSKYNTSKTDKKDVQIDYNKLIKSAIDSTVAEAMKQKSTSETKEPPDGNWWKWLLAGCIIPVVLWFIVKKNWHAKAFVWLLNLFRFKK